MKIIFGADLVPTEANFKLFEDADIGALLGNELNDVLTSADYRIFNLELPLTDKKNPIQKVGPVLSAPTKVINGIKKINPSLVTLANNHILDHGKEGLESTVEILKNNNIDFIGVGNNLDEASKPYIIEHEGIKIGIYVCTEYEFSIATQNSAGANPFDPLESLDHISDLKSKTDYVIVLYHGGKEGYQYPSVNLQKICRKICDKGADIVLCQHSHCIGCEEKYNNSLIVYGQGNFIFNKYDLPLWKTSLLVELSVESDDFSVKYIPIVKNDPGIRLANEAESTEIIEKFNERSKNILQHDFVENEYNKLANNVYNYYCTRIYGKNLFKKMLLKIFKNKYRFKLSTLKTNLLINTIECDSHRELFLRSLKNEKNTKIL